MIELQILIIFDQLNDSLRDSIRDVIKNYRHMVVDFGFAYTHVSNQPAVRISLFYLEEQLTHGNWGQELLSLLYRTKEALEFCRVEVLQIIVGGETLPHNLLVSRNGIWIEKRTAEISGLWHLLLEMRAEKPQLWFFLPFKTDDKTDTEYELCQPDDKIRAFGCRINGSPHRLSSPVGLKICLMEGYRITDYLKTAFADCLGSFQELGGENVILTTLLQMNDKIELTNYYSEKLERSEDLNLYSLPAMNMSLVDQRDETNIAILVTSGKLIIEDITLGD